MSSHNYSSQRWSFFDKESKNLQEYWKKMEQTEERLAPLPVSEFMPATGTSKLRNTTASVWIKLAWLVALVASVFFMAYLVLLNALEKLRFEV